VWFVERHVRPGYSVSKNHTLPEGHPQPDAPAHKRQPTTGAAFTETQNMRTSIFQPFFSVVRLALFVLASVLAFGVGAAAQTLPYEADVAQDASVIRSGAGRGYYVVAEIAKGQRVTVVDERFLWYAIQCPESVTCFIEQKNVDAKGDGKRGVVNTDDTNVYFSHMTKGPSESYRPGGKLHAGDVVEIIEAVDNAYRVVAPKNIYVYMRPNSLTATLADAANDAAAEVPAPAVAEPAAETVATAEPQVVIDVEPIVLNPPVIVAPADAQPLAEAPQTTNAQPAEVPAVEISFDDIPAPATDAKADLGHQGHDQHAGGFLGQSHRIGKFAVHFIQCRVDPRVDHRRAVAANSVAAGCRQAKPCQPRKGESTPGKSSVFHIDTASNRSPDMAG